jgi:hypothetical protein
MRKIAIIFFVAGAIGLLSGGGHMPPARRAAVAVMPLKPSLRDTLPSSLH